MFGRVPAYTDVSHFRAPYKNAYFSGLGASTGATGAASATLDKITERGGDGFRRLDPKHRAMLDYILSMYRVTQKGNQGHMTPFSAAELAAAKQDPKAAQTLKALSMALWVNGQPTQGRMVFMNDATIIKLLQAPGQPIAGAPDYAAFYLADTSPTKAIAKGGQQVLLSEPGGPGDKSFLAKIGPAGVVVGVAALVGGAYLLMRKK